MSGQRETLVTGMGFCLAGPDGRPTFSRQEFWDTISTGTVHGGTDGMWFRSVEAPTELVSHSFPEVPTRHLENYAPVHHYGLAATAFACQDAGLDRGAGDLADAAVLTARATSDSWFDVYEDFVASERAEPDPERGRALFTRLAVAGGTTDLAYVQAALLGAGGPCHTVSSGCASSAVAVGDAHRLIATGMVDIAVVTGVDYFNLDRILRYQALRERVERAEGSQLPASMALNQPMRPYDARAAASNMANGAATLVLESREHAERRGARGHVRVLGQAHRRAPGASAMSADVTGTAAVAAAQRALAAAGVSPDAVDYVNGGAEGNPIYHAVESTALINLLGERAHGLPVTVQEANFGHSGSPLGVMGVAATALMMANGQVCPTAGCEQVSPDCVFDPVPGTEPKPLEIRHALSFNYHVGAGASAIVLGREEPAGPNGSTADVAATAATGAVEDTEDTVSFPIAAPQPASPAAPEQAALNGAVPAGTAEQTETDGGAPTAEPALTPLLRPQGPTLAVEGADRPGVAELVGELGRHGLRVPTADTPADTPAGSPVPDLYVVAHTGSEVYGHPAPGGALDRDRIVAVLEAMAGRGGGRAVLLTDAGNEIEAGADPATAAARAADLHWWKHQVRRFAQYGVTGNTVTTGYAPFLGHRLAEGREAELMEHLLVRRATRVDDVVNALRLLASVGSAHMVGQVLPLDGGADAMLVPPTPAWQTTRAPKPDPGPAPGDPYDLSGSTLLVTGASSGIGQVFAAEAARRGAELVLVGRRADALEATAAEVAAVGGRAHPLPGDLADPSSVPGLVADAWELAGGIDGLVYSAGVLDFDVRGDNSAVRDNSFAVNVQSYAAACDALQGRWIPERRPGTVVAVGSVSAIAAPVPHTHAYGASKAAMLQHTRMLATTSARYGIRANSVLPGIIRTPMEEAVPNSEGFMASLLAQIPQGRLGEPEEVAALLCYLASPASSRLSGASLVIDGGGSLGCLPELNRPAAPSEETR